jgi:NAD+ synthase (glutamine-hydrolysing)
MVYALARDRNARAGRPLVPEDVLTKPPSAELRPDQRDTDSLPPYDVLDPIIEAYVEDDRSPEDLVASGADPGVVDAVVALIDRGEYKRRQAAPGIKITPKAFGRDRRMPITNRYRSARPDRSLA